MVLRPSRTILHDALNGQTANGVRGLRCHAPYIAHGPPGVGSRTKLYASAPLIIDGLGYATWSSTIPFLDPERRLFSEIATLFFERLLRWSLWYSSYAGLVPVVRE